MAQIITPFPSNLRFNNGYAIHTLNSGEGWSCRIFPESLLQSAGSTQTLSYCQEEAEREGVYLDRVGATDLEAFLQGASWITKKRNPEWAGKHKIYLLISNLKAIGAHVYGQNDLDKIQISDGISACEALEMFVDQEVLHLSYEPSLFDIEMFKHLMEEFEMSEIGARRLLNLITSTSK
jgi:hypothetical protein